MCYSRAPQRPGGLSQRRIANPTPALALFVAATAAAVVAAAAAAAPARRLTVSPTNIADLSRITVVLNDVPEGKAAQALKQLSDVVNVWAVVDYTGTNSLQRELVMLKVAYELPAAEAGAGAGAAAGA